MSLTGGMIRGDDWRGFMKEKGGVLGAAGSEVKMGKERRPQAEPEEMRGKGTVEAAIPPPTSEGWQAEGSHFQGMLGLSPSGLKSPT